jgi:hypothetical protein
MSCRSIDLELNVAWRIGVSVHGNTKIIMSYFMGMLDLSDVLEWTGFSHIPKKDKIQE